MAHSTTAPSGDLITQILQALDKSEPIISTEAFPAATFVEVKAALDRLMSRDMVRYDTIERQEALLEPEGEEIAANGSHEARVFEAVRTAMEGLSVQDLEKAIGDKNVVKIGQGKAFKEKWISKAKGTMPASPLQAISKQLTGSVADGKLTAIVRIPFDLEFEGVFLTRFEFCGH